MKRGAMGYWIKVYTDILDDPKYYKLSEKAKLGMYELMLVAKKLENGKLTGELPSIEDIAFYTRKPVEEWEAILPELQAIGFVENTDEHLVIKNYVKRQSFIPSTERSRQYRKKRNDSYMFANAPQEENKTEPETKLLNDRNDIATLCNESLHTRDGETETETETDIDTDKDKDKDKDIKECAKNAQTFLPKEQKSAILESEVEFSDFPTEKSGPKIANSELDVGEKRLKSGKMQKIKPIQEIKPIIKPDNNHPAILAYREVTSRYPPKPNYEQIINALGEKPDLERMRDCYQRWCAHGYKPTNLSWLLEWYVDGVPDWKDKFKQPDPALDYNKYSNGKYSKFIKN